MANPQQLPTGPLATFTRAHAVRAGYSDHEIEAAVRSGQWMRVRRGSYAFAPTSPVALSAERLHVVRAHHVGQRLGDSSVLSHQSAVLLHGLPLWGAALANVQVTRVGARSTRVRAGVKSHRRSLGDDEITMVGALRVTTPARALVDLACEAGFEAAVCSMDAALRTSIVSMTELEAALQRIDGQAGAGHGRRAVAFAHGASESIGESRMRVAISELGLSAPVLQQEFRSSSERVIGRVDFWWPDANVIGEFDGLVKYRGTMGNPVEVLIEEKRREDALRTLTGARVVRVTWIELGDRTRLERSLRAALDHAVTRCLE